MLQGGVARGEQACWSLSARAGQHAKLSITSKEKNAVFQLYEPGWTVKTDDGDLAVEGTAYRGAAEGDDASVWTGRLAKDGANLIVVAATRGGATYRLTVTVEP